MKKKVLALMCVIVLTVIGCGTENAETLGSTVGENKGQSSVSVEKDNEEQPSENKVEFSNEFAYFGHTFCYTDDFQFNDNSAGGMSLAKGTEYWITLDSLDYYGLTTTVESFSEIVDTCQEGVLKMLEDRYSGFFSTNKAAQYVSESKEVDGKYVNALKVKGIFEDTFTGTKYDYVAFYFMAKVGDVYYPFYMIGLVMTGSLEEMEAYMDASLDYIKPVE